MGLLKVRHGKVTARRQFALLTALACASFLLLVGDTALGVALPLARRDLRVGLGGVEWIVNGYTLALAVALLPCGPLVERVGARRLLLVGIGLFAAGAGAAGAAPAFAPFLAARVVQGLGAAATMPASLAVLTGTFTGRRRISALGIWSAAATLAMAVGPLLGGGLASVLGWRSILLGSAVAAALVGLLLVLVLPADGERLAHPFDHRGAVLAVIAVGLLVYTLTNASSWGLGSARVLGLLAASGLAASGFFVVERRCRVPLLDLSLLARGATLGANSAGFALNAAMCSSFFFLALYLHDVGGYSAARAGLVFLPMTVPAFVMVSVNAWTAERLGHRATIVVGLLLVAGSVASLASLGARVELGLLLPALAVMGIGIGVATAPLAAVALTAADPEQTGSAAALLGSSRSVGLAFGVSLMGLFVSGSAQAAELAPALRAGFAATAGVVFVGAMIALLTLEGGGARTTVDWGQPVQAHVVTRAGRGTARA